MVLFVFISNVGVNAMTLKEKLLTLDVYDSPRECAAVMIEAAQVIKDLEDEIEQERSDRYYEIKESW